MVDPALDGAVPSEEGPVEVGVYVSENAAAFGAALGVQGVAAGDSRAQAQAVIEAINAVGGIAGREAVPVFGVIDATSAEPTANQEQAACSLWTEDHRVVAVVAPWSFGGTMIGCLADEGVPLFGVVSAPYSAARVEGNPLLLLPAQLNQSRAMELYADRSVAQGFATSVPDVAAPVRLGLLRYDSPDMQADAEEYLKPALARHGLAVHSEAAISTAGSAADAGRISAEVQNAQLRFRTEGVTHVMFMDAGGLLPLVFMASAESNGYKPAYALTSFSSPDFLGANVPPSQLEGTVGVGWAPVFDVATNAEPPNAAADRCEAIMADAGVDISDQNGRRVAYGYCDGLLLLHEVAADTSDLAGATLVDRVVASGDRVPLASTFASEFAPGRRDSAAAVSDLAFAGECGCFLYTSEPLPR